MVFSFFTYRKLKTYCTTRMLHFVLQTGEIVLESGRAEGRQHHDAFLFSSPNSEVGPEAVVLHVAGLTPQPAIEMESYLPHPNLAQTLDRTYPQSLTLTSQ